MIDFKIIKLQMENEKLKEELKDCINKDKIRKFIEEYLPDEEIIETCSMYEVNGIYVREELEKILGE